MPLQAKAVRFRVWWNRSISRLLFGLPSRAVPAPRKGAAGALAVPSSSIDTEFTTKTPSRDKLVTQEKDSKRVR